VLLSLLLLVARRNLHGSYSACTKSVNRDAVLSGYGDSENCIGKHLTNRHGKLPERFCPTLEPVDVSIEATKNPRTLNLIGVWHNALLSVPIQLVFDWICELAFWQNQN
jgi:hypothetical protein